MKLKGLAILAAAPLVLLSSLAHADAVFRSYAPDFCSTISNTKWGGEGDVTALGGLVHCRYKGDATIGTVTNSDRFSIEVAMTKESGTLGCVDGKDIPTHYEASCHNGVVTFKTEHADLRGDVDSSGTVVNVNGTVTFNFIRADIKNLNLHKKS